MIANYKSAQILCYMIVDKKIGDSIQLIRVESFLSASYNILL